MKDWKQLEEIINSCLRRYEETFHQVNEEYELSFSLTVTTHKVDKEGQSYWVGYMRLERHVKPTGAPESETETVLIYNQAYKFKNTAERVDPAVPWKFDLYQDLLYRMVCSGLEYAELLKRMQTVTRAGGSSIAEATGAKQSDIVVTNQMPAPLTPEELKYKEWVNSKRK